MVIIGKFCHSTYNNKDSQMLHETDTETGQTSANPVLEAFIMQVNTEMELLASGTTHRFRRMVEHFKPTLSRRGLEASPEVKHMYQVRLRRGNPCSLVLIENDDDLASFLKKCTEAGVFIPALSPRQDEKPHELRKRIFNTFKRFCHRQKESRRRRDVLRNGHRFDNHANGFSRFGQVAQAFA